MADGYFFLAQGRVYLSTDNFTKGEREKLIEVLYNNFGAILLLLSKKEKTVRSKKNVFIE